MSVRSSTHIDLRQNKLLRSLGIYTLRAETFILLQRSEYLSFLFTQENWNTYGPVDYRVSHGAIYRQGKPTGLTDDDLVDTGKTANAPSRSIQAVANGFGDQLRTYVPDLVQQHKQNEEIREVCESQRVTMAQQRAAIKLQRASGKNPGQEAIRRLSPPPIKR